MDTTILVCAALCQLALTYLGYRVGVVPPKNELEKKESEIKFVFVGVVGVVLLIVSGIRSNNLQDQVAKDAHIAAVQSTQANQRTSHEPTKPLTPVSPPPPPIPRAIAKKLPIKPLIAIRQTDPTIQTTPTGSNLLGFIFSVANISAETIKGTVVKEKIWVDQQIVVDKGCEGGLGIVAPTTQAVMTCSKNGEPFPIPASAKAIIVEFEVSYDTLPPTGVRNSFRQITFDLNWANGPASAPLLQPRFTKEIENGVSVTLP